MWSPATVRATGRRTAKGLKFSAGATTRSGTKEWRICDDDGRWIIVTDE
jgi:hypothetical protein